MRCLKPSREMKNKSYYRSRLVVQEYTSSRWSFFTATPPLGTLRSLLICATIEELPNDVGQLVAWSEPVVFMLIDVRWAHFHSPARTKMFVELPEEAGTDKSKFGRLLKSMYGCRDAGVSQLRVWVHGDDFVPSVTSSMTHVFFFFRSCRRPGLSRIRNPWTLWIPRLCAKHSSAGQNRGMDC